MEWALLTRSGEGGCVSVISYLYCIIASYVHVRPVARAGAGTDYEAYKIPHLTLHALRSPKSGGERVIFTQLILCSHWF